MRFSARARPAGRSALAASAGPAAPPAAATCWRPGSRRQDRIRPRAPARDNAIAGMPHLAHADFRDLHDRVACPHPSTVRFRPITHIPGKTGQPRNTPEPCAPPRTHMIPAIRFDVNNERHHRSLSVSILIPPGLICHGTITGRRAAAKTDSRDRDRRCWRPPAQIPASGITALGSCHGYLAANRAWGQGCLILVVGR